MVPKNADQQRGCLTPAFSGAQKRAEMLCHPCLVGGPQRQARGGKLEVVPNKGEQNRKWLLHPYILRGPNEGGNATSPLHCRECPTPSAGRKIRNGSQYSGKKTEVATSPLPSRGRAEKRAEMLPHPGILGHCQRQARRGKSEVVPNKGVNKQKWLPHPRLLGGPKEGGNATSPPCILGVPQRQARGGKKMVPNIGEQNQRCLPHPCSLGGPKEGGNAASPVHSWGSPTPSGEEKKKSFPT